MPHAAPARSVRSASRAGLRLLRGLLAVAILAAVAPSGAAQQSFRESPEIEDLKQALKDVERVDKDTFVEKFRDLETATNRVKQLNVMVRAALLQEWVPLLPVTVEPEIWDRERNRILGKLISRVEKRIGTLLAEPNPPLQVGLLGLLRTESEKSRAATGQYDDTGVRRKLLNELSPSVIRAAADPNQDVQIAAILTLGQRIGKPEATVEAYGKVLAGGSVEARRAVAESLDKFIAVSTKKQADLTLSQQGEIFQLLLPVLTTTLADADVLVRRRGGNVLVKLTRNLADDLRPFDAQQNLTPALPDPLKKPDAGSDLRETPTERRAFLRIAQRMAPDLNRLAARLEVAASDPDTVVRALSLAVIEQFAAIRDGLDSSRKEVQDREKETRAPQGDIVPAAFLGAPVAQDPELPPPNKDDGGPLVRATLPTLRTGLKDANVRVRLFALDAIERLGDAAASLLPDLVAALSDRDPFVRWAAARCLRGLAPRQPEAVVPALARLLGERDTDVRIAAIRALTAYKEAAVSTLPALAEQLRCADPNVRIAAITLLNQFGEAAAPAVPALIEILRHEDAKVRVAAAEALGLLGAKATAANAALQRLTTDPSQDVRREASVALYRINQPDPAEKPQPREPRENDPRDR